MNHKKTYTALFITSLLLFLVSFLVQGPLLFTYADDYGLILKMNPIFWIGFFSLLVLVVFQYKNFEHIDARYSYLTLFLIAMYLIAPPFFNEILPRFEDTWSHSFLPQEMFKQEKVNIAISIYEEYPGSFLFYGTLFNFIPTYWVMKFLPPLFYVIGLLAIFIITKNLMNGKIALLTPVIYTFFNWTIEDNHISPQFLNLFLYFIVMFLLIKILNLKKNNLRHLFIIGLLSAAIVFSHPLTPLFLLSILAVMFVFTSKLRKYIFTVFVIVLAIYLVYEINRTTTFYSMVDYLKNFFQIIASRPSIESATSRFAGMSFIYRQIIFGSKMFLTAFSVIFGFIGVIVVWRKKFTTESKFMFAWAFSMIPFVAVMSQVVQGEFYERFVLIASLPLAFLTAYVIEQKKFRPIAILAVLLILTVPFFMAKHGNEAFQSESVEKLNADCFIQDYNTSCEQNMEVAGSALNWDVPNLGETHFGVTREETMAASIYYDTSLTSIFDVIENQTVNLKLDRIYSTYESAAYLQP